MKAINITLTVLIFAFWGVMSTLLVLREREASRAGLFHAGVQQYLENSLLRERWMSIYRDNTTKIGYSGYTLEKAFEDEGVVIYGTLEFKATLDLLGSRRTVEMRGSLVADDQMRPTTLNVSMMLESLPAAELIGQREGDAFRVTLKAGVLPPLSITLPLGELALGDALTPILPIAGFQVGDTLRVPSFDPITLERSPVELKVVEEEVKEFGGVKVDVFRLETRFRAIASTLWATASGEVMLQKFGPPLEAITLRRDTAEQARRMPRS